jgi:hypothetical protein
VERNGTQVMMLGRVPPVQIDPQMKVQWIDGASSYDQPQNLMRPTINTFPDGAFGGLSRAGRAVPRVARGAADHFTLGRVGRFLGDTPTTQLSPPAAAAPCTSCNASGLVLMTLMAASSAAAAYHGYKRNQSVGWAIWWGVMGYVAPVITPAVAVAQGFGKRGR